MRYTDGWRRTWANYHLRQIQGGVCAVCRGVPSYRFAVDHCHSSGEVRGLLCYRCNTVVNYYEMWPTPNDKPEVAAYLADPPGAQLVEPEVSDMRKLAALIADEPWVRPYHLRQLGLRKAS